MQEWLLYELIYVYYGMRRKLRGCPYGEHDELRRSKSAHYGAQNQRKSLFYAIKNKVLHRF